MIDLSDPSIYRDLSKPMGALNPNRYQCLLVVSNKYTQF